MDKTRIRAFADKVYADMAGTADIARDFVWWPAKHSI